MSGMVERAAEAICREQLGPVWCELTDRARAPYRRMASAALAAVTEQPTRDQFAKMHKDIAVVASEKLVKIRELVTREPTTPLANRILIVLNDTRLMPGQALEETL